MINTRQSPSRLLYPYGMCVTALKNPSVLLGSEFRLLAGLLNVDFIYNENTIRVGGIMGGKDLNGWVERPHTRGRKKCGVWGEASGLWSSSIPPPRGRGRALMRA